MVIITKEPKNKKIYEMTNAIGVILEILNEFYGKSSFLMEGCHKMNLEFLKLRIEAEECNKFSYF